MRACCTVACWLSWIFLGDDVEPQQFQSGTNQDNPAQEGNSELDVAFMRLALEEAEAAAREGEVPIGAVVVCDGAVIARAHNRRELDADPSAHAEFMALLKAARSLGRWRLSGCTVYVTLEPCVMCAGLMVNARVDRCVYGAPDPKGGALGTLYRLNCDDRLNHAFEVCPGVLQEECAEVLKRFFKQRREEQKAAKRLRQAAQQSSDSQVLHHLENKEVQIMCFGHAPKYGVVRSLLALLKLLELDSSAVCCIGNDTCQKVARHMLRA